MLPPSSSLAQDDPLASQQTPSAFLQQTSSSSSNNKGLSKRRYWSVMEQGSLPEKQTANAALMDYAVGTINTMYYDHSGGTNFQPTDFYSNFRSWMRTEKDNLQNRENVVRGLKWLVSTLNDPFSKYMTREELKQEIQGWNNGFLGLGAVVEAPSKAWYIQTTPVLANLPLHNILPAANTFNNKPDTRLAVNQVLSLPIVTAVAPDSPAERAGLTVGDRIVAVGTDGFLGKTESQLEKRLNDRYSAENYLGYPTLTIAKPIYAALRSDDASRERDVIVAYRPAHVKLPTVSVEPFQLNAWAKGDANVHYELLSSQDSIFAPQKVGYIRLTRFSKATTKGFIKAIDDLEASGATSFIIDLRNNYGGIIQEAMLTASTLLRDPHAVLCFTLNSRGGFTPHDVEEYVVDSRYPGYLMSHEPRNVVISQVKRENPAIFEADGIRWNPPSAYASLHEQGVKRNLHRVSLTAAAETPTATNNINNNKWTTSTWLKQRANRQPLVVLVNEGTASSAEVFASALRDNGRTVALVGTKTYGKGLIQHSFPLPDGGALRLTVAEYLTPALQHVTNVGGAQYSMGERIGGGIHPDIVCESKQGIPNNVGADLCVGVALDALEEANTGLNE